MTDLQILLPGRFAITLHMPTEWDELSLPELRAVASVLHHDGSKQELLVTLIRLRARAQAQWLPSKWERMLDPEGAAIEGLPLVDVLLDRIGLTINPHPRVGALIGPADCFNDLTAGEFEDAEISFAQYSADRSPHHLATLAGLLWRPPGPDGKRRTFIGYSAPAKSFSRRHDAATLQLIHLWYAGCRAQLVTLFPRVFGSGGGGGGRAGSGAPDLQAFTKLIHSAAGPKNGTREQVRATLLKELLYECELAAMTAEEMESKMKDATRK